MLEQFEEMEDLVKDVNINGSVLNSVRDKIKSYREALEKQIQTEKTEEEASVNKKLSL